jgi:hypothetical protein
MKPAAWKIFSNQGRLWRNLETPPLLLSAAESLTHRHAQVRADGAAKERIVRALVEILDATGYELLSPPAAPV